MLICHNKLFFISHDNKYRAESTALVETIRELAPSVPPAGPVVVPPPPLGMLPELHVKS